MSPAMQLTQCQARLQEAGREASAAARKLRGLVPVEMYDELMLQLCGVAACATDLKVILGTMRMIGELEQRPAPVTTETLELSQCVKHDRSDRSDDIDVSEGTRRAFAHQLEMIGDDTLSGEGES
jgi:hypothetical protein